MAFTYTQTPGTSPVYERSGALRRVIADLNITSYTNPNGETITPSTFGMARILGVNVIGAPRGFVVNYVTSTGKLTVAQDNGTATAAALPEVPNTTNVGTVRVEVIGQ